ncbi:spore germination protein [Aureibacillus halotolerans]|uniref:Spore germination protein PA n=1 Tax=Aureibacillus halotolerans TaxID=1508390 RepID=A0A4R6UAY0_9BACI|nr:spore germination protein [Aureibacillus halotolerans]TDQ42079.1 spore germination protein PA [Aureibacillus halotolerans]
MPAIVGAIKVLSIGEAGVFHVGDVFSISPKSVSKTFAGAGSFNTGNGLTVSSYLSATNTYDQDAVDQAMIGNL